MKKKFTSSEFNLVVYRYLLESGFDHSAFVFGKEAGLSNCPIDVSSVTTGALVGLVNKGLHCIELEANMSNPNSDMNEDLSFLQPLDLITKNVEELHKILNENREKKSETNPGVDFNHLVYRYFQDSGFGHSIFVFEKETDILKYPIDGSSILQGALIVLVVKGLQYIEMEANLPNSDSDMDEGFSFLQAMDLITKNVEELKEVLREKREEKIEGEGPPKKVRFSSRLERQKPPEEQREREKQEHMGSLEVYGILPMVLKGHTSEVECCAWSPTDCFLASGSGDATARIWTVPYVTNRSTSPTMIQLNHGVGKVVSALDWNGDGTLLATGSADGYVRIWRTNGQLKSILGKHKGPIISLKWNKSGDHILTGSSDDPAIVWDVKVEMLKQQCQSNAGFAIDWRDDVTFATSSKDYTIDVYRIGKKRPIKRFSGHKEIVNCIKWDPTGSLLASCSDDRTVKIWSMKQERFVHDLRGHSNDIYLVSWRPTGLANQPSVLASASFDSMVKLWDVEKGKLIYTLESHMDSVYGLAFSPNGEYLATGSKDKSVHVWSLKDGEIIKSYTGTSMINAVSWNREGDKVAACFSDGRLCVLDIRR